MRGGYDLHGRYYPNREDAINAETTQCNEIDLAHMRRDMQRMERQQHPDQEYHELWQYCQSLEQRIAFLEEITKHLRPA